MVSSTPRRGAAWPWRRTQALGPLDGLVDGDSHRDAHRSCFARSRASTCAPSARSGTPNIRATHPLIFAYFLPIFSRAARPSEGRHSLFPQLFASQRNPSI